MAYLEGQLLDDKKEVDEDYTSWECQQIGRHFHQGCDSRYCLCDCHWSEPGEL